MAEANKSLGQNFLHDEEVLRQIIEAAELSKEDTILEIGPGKGALTNQLLDQAGKVIAVELDDRLIPVLMEEFGSAPNFKLIHQDVLKYTPPSEPYKIVANIPYYITSPILNHFLMEQFQDGNPPKTIIIMIQKEVAQKILAKKGKHSVLSLQVHLFGEPELVCIVPRTAFDPQPKVDSAVIKITVQNKPKIDVDLKKFFWLLHMSFAQKRKMLSNNLANAFKKEPEEIRTFLKNIDIDEGIRAEQLTIEEWLKLYQAYYSNLHS